MEKPGKKHEGWGLPDSVHVHGRFSARACPARDAPGIHEASPASHPPTLLPLHSAAIAPLSIDSPIAPAIHLAMPSQEAKLLSDFLLAPASLRDFVTLRQFTDIFPQSLRDNPAIQDLYRELHKLRQEDMDIVRQDVVNEVKRSKQMKRGYARERRQVDDANVAGLDPIALQMEQEVPSWSVPCHCRVSWREDQSRPRKGLLQSCGRPSAQWRRG